MKHSTNYLVLIVIFIFTPFPKVNFKKYTEKLNMAIYEHKNVLQYILVFLIQIQMFSNKSLFNIYF